VDTLPSYYLTVHLDFIYPSMTRHARHLILVGFPVQSLYAFLFYKK